MWPLKHLQALVNGRKANGIVTNPVLVKTVTAVLMATALVSCQAPEPDVDTLAKITAAVNAPERRADWVARDQYRHPIETLAFFQVEPQHTVVEIWPGGGWYTEILAPLLKEEGRFYAAHFPAETNVAYFRKSLKAYREKLAADPIYGDVIISALQPPAFDQVAPDGSADRVLTFRNVHNWMKAGSEKAVFSSLYNALKEGGYLGVVEHRAKPGTPYQTMIDSGYVTEAKVKQLAKDAGFVFVASSDINANDKDTTNHPKGVWTLPPSLRLGDEDRAFYQDIGESDRMTLLFQKTSD